MFVNIVILLTGIVCFKIPPKNLSTVRNFDCGEYFTYTIFANDMLAQPQFC